MSDKQEVIGEKVVCYCRKKVSERVVPYTSTHRAIEIVVEGRGMTPARCIVLKSWTVH